MSKKRETLVSKVLQDGTIIETVYNSGDGVTAYAIFKDGNITTQSTFETETTIYEPPSSHSTLLSNNVVLLPEQAEDYVSTEFVVTEVQSFIHDYLSVSESYEKIATYYVLLSWLYDKFSELPYLRALGDYGSGKSRLLQTIGVLCYKPIFMTGATSTSAMFRIIDLYKGTIVLDEADFHFSDTKNELVKILNSGFSKGMSVLRSEVNASKGFDVTSYNVYGPKIIAGREPFQDMALESRCLVENMERTARTDIPLNLRSDFWRRASSIRNRLLSFRFHNYSKEVDFDQELGITIEPRLKQIVIPLISVVDNEPVKAEIIDFIRRYNDEIVGDRGYSFEAELLRAVIDAIERFLEPTVGQVADVFNEMAGMGKDISPRSMGFSIRNKLKLTVLRRGKGFYLENNPKNRESIQKLRAKFGITEDVNPESSDPFTDETVKNIKDVFGVEDKDIETIPSL